MTKNNNNDDNNNNNNKIETFWIKDIMMQKQC